MYLYFRKKNFNLFRKIYKQYLKNANTIWNRIHKNCNKIVEKTFIEKFIHRIKISGAGSALEERCFGK